ncbi:MAG: ABC transporter permease [Candidatus Methanomethylophilaceae archaeon]|nr:ABC transporter permease [Candidatus Methanomethylophilaceae archaeon]
MGVIGLSNRSLMDRLGRTSGITLIVLAIAFVLLTGTIVVDSLKAGETNVEKRLGADLMAVPAGSGYAEESILVNGAASSFYMPAGIESEIGAVTGVERTSSQFYMTSISDADCCEFLVQLIGYDPETDFTVTPWISESYSSEVGIDQLVVGSNIQVKDGSIRLFDHMFEVVAKLAESGTGMDNSVFMTKDTIRHMAEYASELGFIIGGDVDSEVSVVLVDVDQDYSASQVSRRIQSVGSGSEVDVVASTDVVSRITAQMGSLTGYVEVLESVVVGISAVILAALFVTAVGSRKGEFAVLRMIGATRRHVVSMAVYESATMSALGALAGVVLALATILPFSGMIGDALGMPYSTPSLSSLIPGALSAFTIAFAIGPLVSLAAACSMSRKEAYTLLREGE